MELIFLWAIQLGYIPLYFDQYDCNDFRYDQAVYASVELGIEYGAFFANGKYEGDVPIYLEESVDFVSLLSVQMGAKFDLIKAGVQIDSKFIDESNVKIFIEFSNQ